MIESGGNPNYSDYGGFKPRYRLYSNRNNEWWCFTWLDPLKPIGVPGMFVGVCGRDIFINKITGNV